MDIFQEVKQRTDILKVCDLLGIKLNRSHMTTCMFHSEKTPSFSVSQSKQIFKCFGCGESGDSITLVSKVLNITPFEAVKFLNSNLGLGLNISGKQSYNFYAVNTYENKRKTKEMFEKWKNETFINLCIYLHNLEKKYAEKCKIFSNIETADDFFNDEDVIRYCNEADKIQYYIDFFIYGNEEDLLWLKKTKGKVVKL